MAAVAQPQLVNITINGIPLAVPKGEMVVESAKRLGIEIPVFCYHKRLKPVGMCRMCLIEMGSKGPDGSVRMFPKPQAACSLPASEGLVVLTDTEKLHADRKGVLEFLLVNHPLDCPICDRGGECPLQNNTLFYGPSTSRFIEAKRHAPKAVHLSKHVTLDLERCIQCGRCVRFTEEISGDAQLAFRFRGASMQPSTFKMTDFSSKFSGNVIEICPVGALTNSDYRFRARPWDLQTRPSICTNCGVGCNIYLDYRGSRFVRVNGRTNDAINEEWTCDKGKFGHGYLNSTQRISDVLCRKGTTLAPAGWTEAYQQIKAAFVGKPCAHIGGAKNSNEDIFMLRRLFTDVFKSNNYDHRSTRFIPTASSPAKVPAVSLEDIESSPTVLIFGANLADDAPIAHLRVRKAWMNRGCKVVVANSVPSEVEEFAFAVLRYQDGEGSVLADGLSKCVAGSTQESVAALSAQTGVDVRELTTAIDALKSDGVIVITSDSVYEGSKPEETERSISGLAETLRGSYCRFGLQANSSGASLIYPPTASTREILQGCVDGRIKALWLTGWDGFKEFPDPDLVRKALESVETLVVQESVENECVPFASIVLPMCAPAEMDGSYTNVEGRVQEVGAVLLPKGESKPAWLVAVDLEARLNPDFHYGLFSAKDVFDLISAHVPAFADLSISGLAHEGDLLGRPAPGPIEAGTLSE